MPPTATLFEKAVEAHRGGQWGEARLLYNQLLQREPRNADALNLAGLLFWQSGEPKQAIGLLRRAVSVDPSQPSYLNNLAEAHRAAGQLAEAIECYTQSLRIEPKRFESHNNLGTLFQANSQFDEAVTCYRRALQIMPDNADCLFNLATALQRQGNLQAAAQNYEQVLALSPNHFRALLNLGGIRALERKLDLAQHYYERAVAIEPNTAGLYYNLGNVVEAQGQVAAAVTHYRRALELQPDYPEAMCNLGSALQDMRQFDEAVALLERAVQLRPDFAAGWCNLGVAMQDLGRLDEARRHMERTLELEPWRLEFVFNLATILKDQGDIPAAIERFDHVLRAQPKNAKALCSRGTALLSIGDFKAGFAGYESRVGLPQFNTRTFSQKRWDGSPLGESTLLVHSEQGFGDTLQFIRYLPMVRERGKSVVVATNPELIPLLTQSGFEGIVSINAPLPTFDVHIPLLSLPHLFGTELETVPSEVPYLAADSARVEHWGHELAAYDGFKIGIVWQGRANFRGDRLRSMRLADLAPLASLRGVRLFSLQKGIGSEQLVAGQFNTGGRLSLVDLGSRLDDQGAAFVDTAAVIKHLDLVITTDTAMAHLAGAMAAKVWVALSGVPDWRWMLSGDTNPWYPTMRVFRQTTLGQWPDVVERMAATIAERG